MMIAFDAVASSTSLSLIAPTAEWMILIRVLSSDSLASVSASTSAEPCTSALMMIGSSFDAFFRQLRLQRFEREARAPGGVRLVLGLALAERRDLPRLGGIGDLLEAVAG